MRLDYALDDLAPSWIASGLPPDWNNGAHQRLKDGVMSQLSGLRDYEPTADIIVNGFHAATDSRAYYDFIDPITGGEFEWFAFGNHPGATVPQSNIFDSIGNMIAHTSIGKRAIAQVGGLEPNGPTNHDARRKSLALYLIVADENNYYHYTTDNYYTTLEYYPEWDLPLGNPLVPLLDMTANDLQPFGIQGLIGREFENGWTLFNAGTDPVTIPFDTPIYEAVLVGGRVPEVGGDGALVYEERVTLVLDAWDGALVLKKAP
jgi:hypothetical protein